ncbi:GAF domain-containing protein [Aliidiomarina maris]|uniref:GAF domain-containing protein n=1 Tax=Aliidiomarina maris TaxID=531312 RepID=A0A327WZR9_9GAMM|nr:GAF domain-containing protein [Aliidiomarina maris]RAJ98949.1 GAF domain-containing protein [Aliidiomarina maris]RUO25092.1 GAF domain-containing protein [Aliidiomarina maris]
MNSDDFARAAGTPTDYALMSQQAEAITAGEPNLYANLANLSALLNEHLDHINWVGFYLTTGNDNNELVLGPFQGKVACVRIPFGRGVCGTAASSQQTQLVADVHAFPGHIACDSASNSEIVIPIVVNDQVVAVLDIDSPQHNRFSEQDQQGLERLLPMLQQLGWSYGK